MKHEKKKKIMLKKKKTKFKKKKVKEGNERLKVALQILGRKFYKY